MPTYSYSNLEQAISDDKTHLFRYHNTQGEINLYLFEIVKYTPKGCFISMDGYRNYNELQTKFILNNALRSYAHPTREQALDAFIARKNKQLKILDQHTKNAVASLDNIKDLRTTISNYNEMVKHHKLLKINKLLIPGNNNA